MDYASQECQAEKIYGDGIGFAEREENSRGISKAEESGKEHGTGEGGNVCQNEGKGIAASGKAEEENGEDPEAQQGKYGIRSWIGYPDGNPIAMPVLVAPEVSVGDAVSAMLEAIRKWRRRKGQ